MAIINFLPEFKLVEINRSTGLVMGHVVAQFPLDPGFAGIIDDYEYDMVENGFILGLSKDLEVEAYDPAAHGHPFLLFTEELNTFFDGLKWYATGADEEDGIIYPRLVGLYPGDVFTTNNFGGTYTNQKFAKIVDGQLSLQEVKNAQTMFAVEESTLPTGDLGLRFTFIGSFAGESAPAPQPSINDVEVEITADVPPFTNVIQTSTTFSGVAGLPNAWITDAFLQSDKFIPQGVTVKIINPALPGNAVAISTNGLAPNTQIWLSDILKEQAPALTTRAKLNIQTTQVFDIEVFGLEETGKITFTIIASSAAGLEGSTQTTKPITQFTTLATKVIEEATFTT